ncbi:MAG: hypothetical protein ACK2U2_23160 [Anaerolineae bacterium]|jgi:hypothetical protein
MLPKWLLALCLSSAFGVLYVRYLTIHRLKMSRYLLAATLAFVAAVASLVVGFQRWELVVAIMAAIGSALAGYLLCPVSLHETWGRSVPIETGNHLTGDAA